MKYILSGINDIDLAFFEAVTRHRAGAELSDDLARRIDERRAEFLAFVDGNRDAHLYGITTRHHVGAKHVLDQDGYGEFATRLPASGATFGRTLPDEFVRGIVVARLADFVNGNGTLRAETVGRLLDLLSREELPAVPARGNGEPGDIIPLGYLFRDVFNGTLEVGEGMALINGSPVASAALADAAVRSRRYSQVLERSFALAALAVSAPLQHYDARFEQLWNDPYLGETLGAIRGHLVENPDVKHLAYQAPVSFRSAPRVLGWFRRTVASVADLATVALRTSSNNPAFFGPAEAPPLGAIYSNGGYHHAYASPALDGLTRSVADVTQLLAALNNQVTEGPGQLLAREPEAEVATLYHVTTGWAEEARAAATPTLLSLGNPGQTDTGTPDLLAWRKFTETAEALEACTTILTVSAAHAIARKKLNLTGRLAILQKEVLDIFPVGTKPIDFGAKLADVRTMLFESQASPII